MQLAETGRSIAMRGFGLVLDGVAVMIQEATAQLVIPAKRGEVLYSHDIARESGFSTATLSHWCKTSRVAGAVQRVRGGRWSATREAWDAAIAGVKSGPRRRRLKLVKRGVAA